jgi:hypothetical protein
VHTLLGFKHVCRQVSCQRVADRSPVTAEAICEAVAVAACFYWKRVYCLQRAVVTARLLKAAGMSAELVIGYRPSPFSSHAWVEVDGRVINDSPAYKERMLVLHKL